MLNLSATEYFRNIGDLMNRLEATDQNGAHLPIDDAATVAVEYLTAVAQRGGKLFLIGNGGSSAIASHTQNDFAKALGIKAMTFTDTPLLTALSNDEGYGGVFESPILLWGAPGDLLIAIRSSGRSENILGVLDACRTRWGQTLSFSG